MKLGKKFHRMTRRDLVHFVGLRCAKLDNAQSAAAWQFLARHLGRLGERDMPKFIDLLAGIRAATIHARRPPTEFLQIQPASPDVIAMLEQIENLKNND